jgi:hypothetical protein
MDRIKGMRGLFLVLAAVVLSVPVSYAQQAVAPGDEPLKEIKIPMPPIEKLPEVEFTKTTKLYDEIPFNDKALAFRVRIPTGWTKNTDIGMSNFSISENVFGEVARFYGEPRVEGERSRFTINALELEYQLTAEQWFLQYLLSNGYTLQGIKTYNENRVEALYVLLEHDISYIVRAVAVLNGKRMVLAQYFLPIEFWDVEKKMQNSVVSSFVLTDAEKGFVENMKIYQFLDVAEMKYPESWELRAQPLRSIDQMGVQLFNFATPLEDEKTTTLDGKIDVRLVSSFDSESLEAEIEVFKQEIKEKGLVLGDIIETEMNYEFSPELDFAKVEVYRATDDKDALVNYELWLAIMSAGDYYYFITLLTPSRGDDFYVWSRNTQTFKLILENIAPMEGATGD